MSGRGIPHASAVITAIATILAAHGEDDLRQALDGIHQATCDLVQALQAEREAPTHSLQRDARAKAARALDTLRHGLSDSANSEAR